MKREELKKLVKEVRKEMRESVPSTFREETTTAINGLLLSYKGMKLPEKVLDTFCTTNDVDKNEVLCYIYDLATRYLLKWN